MGSLSPSLATNNTSCHSDNLARPLTKPHSCRSPYTLITVYTVLSKPVVYVYDAGSVCIRKLIGSVLRLPVTPPPPSA